ncbi:MAG: hypothetical protein AB1486_29085 [Planctomycetota bacterium]
MSQRKILTGLWLMALSTMPPVACGEPPGRPSTADYALEHWEPDAYVAEVITSAASGREVQASLRCLIEAAKAKQPSFNLDVRVVPGAAHGPSGDAASIVIYPPRSSKARRPMWRAALTMESVRALLESPARKRIARLLAGGETAVWVLLECSDAEKNDAAASLLTRELEALERTLKPSLRPTAEATEEAHAGHSVSFSLLRVRHNDAGEDLLKASLLGSIEDLARLCEPMAFAVFGRGCSLDGLLGSELDAARIRETCEFLVRSCPHEHKRECPGLDLLVRAVWVSGRPRARAADGGERTRTGRSRGPSHTTSSPESGLPEGGNDTPSPPRQGGPHR